MAIYTAPTIKVSGQGNLKVFSVDYQVATIDSPGKVIVTYIDENNILNPPVLSAVSSTQIQIGSMTFTGYPVSYEKINSATGENLLKVTYLDGSFILDKYYIGLRGKHSNSNVNYKNLYNNISDKGLTYQSIETYDKTNSVNTSEIPNWFIIVGEYVDPCFKEMEKDENEDVCNPCPEGDNQKAKNSLNIDCKKLRSTEIMEVDYSFLEFLTALQAKGIRVSITSTYNNDYRTSYTGSLREVLQSWCSDFGFSFFYYDNIIYIYDLNHGVTITPNLSESQIIEKTESASIEHTKSTACISYVGINGEEREYSCSADLGRKVICKPLTIQDIGALGLKGEYGTSDDDNFINLVEFLCMLSGYSKTLRQMVTWFDIYGIRSANDAEKFIDRQTDCSFEGMNTKGGNYYALGVNDDKNEEKYSLPLLNMTIKKVIKPGSSEFTEIIDSSGNLDEETKKLATDSTYGPYFFIGSKSEAGLSNKLDWESHIASDFLGKYFIRWFSYYTTENPSVDACQGDTAQYYKQGTSALNFKDFFPYFSLDNPELSSDRNKYIKPSNWSSLPIYKFNSEQDSVSDSFILVERKPIWYPAIGEGAEIKAITKKANRHWMINLGSVGSFGNFLNNHPDLKNKDRVFGDQDFLFLAFSMPSGFNISIESGVNHVEEYKNKDLCKVSKDKFATPFNLGLKSFQTTRVNIGGIADFYFPPQAKKQNVETGSSGGYAVYVNNEKSANYKYVIPKFEAVTSSYYNDNNVLKNEVNYKNNVNLDGINVIEKKSIRGSNACIPNYNEIINRMQEYSDNMKSIVSGLSKKETYEIAGLPTFNYKPTNGLVGLSVRIGSKGVTTTLEFSDMKDRHIEKSDSLKEFEFLPKKVISASIKNNVSIKPNQLSRNITDYTVEI